MFEAFGKVILFGEHAVVHGRPALAVGWPGAVRSAGVRPADRCRVRVPDWGLDATEGDPGPAGEALARLREALPGSGGVDVQARASIPAAAGLGSSAALAVVLVRALAAVRDLDLSPADLLQGANALERVFHGNPSGLDAAVAFFGGTCLFRRDGWADAPDWAARFPPLAGGARRLPWEVPGLVIGDSGETRSTAARVAAVSALAETHPKRFAAFLDGAEAALIAGLDAMDRGDATALGAALDQAHERLCEAGVSTPALDRLADTARAAGALGAKLTGAGGGGCVVALAPGREDAVLEAWRAQGFRGFVPGNVAEAGATRESAASIPGPRPGTARGGTATARAGANIALVKYWGKRDATLNLPASGSLSLTLAGLGTRTTVTFDDQLGPDQVVLDGRNATAPERDRVTALLDLVRKRTGLPGAGHVRSWNTVPTAAGLASSASGFAALAAAAWRAAGQAWDLAAVADLARRGSGSAPRSLLGGFVELPAGSRTDGSDVVPRPVPGASGWDLRLVIALAGRGPKTVGSTEGMERTRLTSPLYPAWLALCARHLDAARAALQARSLDALGPVMEESARAMHATALAASPPVVYWTPLTLALLEAVRRLRSGGTGAWATMDAGPHVKVLCRPDDAAAVAQVLAGIPGVVQVLEERAGAGVEVSDGPGPDVA